MLSEEKAPLATDFCAAEIIRLLELKPHPEGRHFRETFRDSALGADGRAASTLIYYFLAAGEVSRWHKIEAAEVWHYYAGAPLEIQVSEYGNRIDLAPLA